MPGILSSRLRGRRRDTLRGFTLIELMVVVILIAVFSGLAIPSLLGQLRNQRTRDAAASVAAIFRTAKLQAMGRGVAVNIRFNNAGNGTLFSMVALRQVASNANPPVGAESCIEANWNGTVGTAYRIDGEVRGSNYDDIYLRMLDEAGTAISTLDVCFTPMGRSFTRINFANPLTPLTAVHQTRVFRSTDGTTIKGRERQVLVLPNGMARVSL